MTQTGIMPPQSGFIQEINLKSKERVSFLSPFFLLVESGSFEIYSLIDCEIQIIGETPHTFDAGICSIARKCSVICEVQSFGDIQIQAGESGCKLWIHKPGIKIHDWGFGTPMIKY